MREQKTSEPKLDVKKEEALLAAKKDSANKQLAVNSTSSKGAYIYHTVRKGENLYAIAKRYHMKATEIKALNNLKTDALKIGQKLKIRPKGE